MSFDYDKIKNKSDGGGGEHWTSNSDLFMVLSVVFLLLYVVASVRNGTGSITKAIEVQKLKNQKEDLKQQLQAYNTLKNDYLKNDAQENEVKMYQDLMSKLDMLQTEAERKRKLLELKAEKNADQKEALNKYQQMVRNIINTNLLAKKRIKRRDKVIVTKRAIINEQVQTIADLDETVTTQSQDIEEKAQLIQNQNQEILEKQEVLEQRKAQIVNLNEDILQKKETLERNKLEITKLNKNLGEKITELKKEYKDKKKTQKQMRMAVLKLRLENKAKINSLESEKETVTSKLSDLESEIVDANQKLVQANESIQAKEFEKSKLQKEYELAAQSYQEKLSNMESNFENKISEQRSELNKKLSQEKASAAEKSKRLAEFKEKADQERSQLESALGNLKNKVTEAKAAFSDMKAKADDYQKKLDKAKSDHGKYLASVSKLKKENQELSGDLGKYKEIVDAKKKLAKNIAENLAKKGIKADVNKQTGEVTINFGDEYFDSGKAQLKYDMKKVLEKFVPEYSSSLFNDPKIAEKIKAVEIIGFSSPTYRGKFVDPLSLKKEDRAALNYNLDLSFKRARNIFKYMTDTEKMAFSHQKKLQSLIKVTGRSYLAEEVQGRGIASGMSRRQYCKKFDCKKSQKVIIRFNLKN